METHDGPVDSADPTTLARFDIGTAVLGQTQFLPGYSLLLCSTPGVERLTDLPRPRRREFLAAMEILGEAVEIVCERRDPAFRRVNLEILGNLTPGLHAHVWPRYEWEPYEFRIRQVGRYPLEQWHEPQTQLGPRHDELRDELRAELAGLLSPACRVTANEPREDRPH